MGIPIYKIKKLDLCSLNRTSPLGWWFYNLVQKDIVTLNDSDICCMLRQDIYLDIAVPKALEILAVEPFCGPIYNGQMIQNLIDALLRNPINLKDPTYISLLERIRLTLENKNWNSIDEAECEDLKTLTVQFYRIVDYNTTKKIADITYQPPNDAPL